MQFKPFQECMSKGPEEIALDMNMSVADFEKMQNSVLSHVAYEALDKFRAK